LKRVKLTKPEEKPHFQTRAEIERQIQAGGLSKRQIDELWDALYLTTSEIDELLAYVHKSAQQPFIYPMFCFAAHTGARRSELLRAQVSDVDFDGQTIVIHERKRAHDRRTTRRLPLTPLLSRVLKDWLEIHPGGAHLFCQSDGVIRSKKKRKRPAAITRDEAHDHFKRPLSKSKWDVLKGWHVFRHSFISCLASAGVDQRFIDEFVGHCTEQQRKRYRHLTPNVMQEAVFSVFGSLRGS
jgi:integrase